MMTPEMLAKLRHSLVTHEDKTNFPYLDSHGNITIGIGYNLTARGLPDSWINNQYNEDVNYYYHQLKQHFDWFLELNQDRQIILIDMCFMGFKKFLSFKKMLVALAKKDYRIAAYEMLNSKWADDVKGRAVKLATAMEAGTYHI